MKAPAAKPATGKAAARKTGTAAAAPPKAVVEKTGAVATAKKGAPLTRAKGTPPKAAAAPRRAARRGTASEDQSAPRGAGSQRGRPDPGGEVSAARAAEEAVRGGSLSLPRDLRGEPRPPAGARPGVDLRLLGRGPLGLEGPRPEPGREGARPLAAHAARAGPRERWVERHPAAARCPLVVHPHGLRAAQLPRRAGCHPAVRRVPAARGEQHRRDTTSRPLAPARASAHELPRRERTAALRR